MSVPQADHCQLHIVALAMTRITLSGTMPLVLALQVTGLDRGGREE